MRGASRRAAPRLLLLLLSAFLAVQDARADVAGDVDAAAKAGDTPRLRQIAARLEEDGVWLVVEVLCTTNRHPAAMALAEVTEFPDADRLRAYALARRDAAEPDGPRRALLRAQSAVKELDFETALRLLQDPLEDTVLQVETSLLRGLVRLDLRQPARAVEDFRVAAGAAERMGWRRRAAEAWLDAATAAEEYRDYEEALRFRQSVFDLLTGIGETKEAARALADIAGVMAERRDYRGAIAIYERALKQLAEQEDDVGLATAQSNLAAIHFQLGRLTEALRLAEESLEIAEKAGDPPTRAFVLSNLAVVRGGMGQYELALDLTLEALEVLRLPVEAASPEPETWRTYAAAVGNLGTIGAELAEASREELTEKGFARRLGDAQAQIEKALQVLQRLGEPQSIALAECALANVHAARGDFVTALPLYRTALERVPEGRDPYRAVQMRAQMATALRKAGRPEDAEAEFKRARDRARGIEARDVLFECLSGLSKVELAQGRPEDAIGTAREAVKIAAATAEGFSDSEGAAVRARRADAYETGALAALALDDPVACAEFLEAGRAGALLDAFGQRAALREAALPADLLRALGEAREQEATAVERLRRGEAGASAKVEAARRRLLDLHERAQRESRASSQIAFPAPDDLATVRKHLRDLGGGAVLVVYGICRQEEGQEASLALVVTGEAARIVRLKTGAVLSACEALRAEKPVFVDTSGVEALREAVWEPLGIDPKTKRVLISPDGPLAYVPFTLLTGSAVTFVPSGTFLGVLLADRARRGEKVLALGDPVYESDVDPVATDVYAGGRLDRLPRSGAEASEVGDEVLLRERATQGELERALGGRTRWRSVHLAAHCEANDSHPELSWLALTKGPNDDGFLTALEVFDMQVRSDLVVLSACESVRGRVVRGEGLRGFVHALQFAGTPRVIASLWDVDDAATAEFMKKFYETWKPGVDTADALRAAQDHLEKGANGASRPETWKAPGYWAAWVLWGLPD